MKLWVIDKMEICLTICKVMTSNINSNREKGCYEARSSAAAAQGAGQTWRPPVRVLDDRKSLEPRKGGGGVPKTLVVVSMQQSALSVFEEASDPLCSVTPASTCLSQRWAYSQFEKAKTGIEAGEVSENHSCKKCCTSAELIMTNMSDHRVSGWLLEALFMAFCSNMWFPWWQDGCLVDSGFGATWLALMLTGSDSFDWDEKIWGPLWLSQTKPSLQEWVCL